ncbi:phosphatase PAP2 family protein [Pedobacter changchengzhani]|uniref:Phosphatase PAP2 family protein n=1 Tax=Pedobacter changchengzhani TaxID=2529274 RepID=A0A4R5MK65_9SPHI|nr:phosphatase PAP2 family protein [Pedobacter changchengzhani]TDG36044.1 phosphatase PAP2 family protein [Pedobacter changchengzhani]
MIEKIQHFDANLFLKINRGMANPFFDWLLPLMRNPYFWAPLYIFIIAFCIIQYKKTGCYLIAVLLLTVGLSDLTASRIIKPLVSRPRPCNEITLVNDIMPRVRCGTGLSFPSAHATNHFAIAVFLIFVFYSRWKAILPIGLAWAAIISFSQIYVGVHYPIDVVAGSLLGICIGLICGKIFKTLQPEF